VVVLLLPSFLEPLLTQTFSLARYHYQQQHQELPSSHHASEPSPIQPFVYHFCISSALHVVYLRKEKITRTIRVTLLSLLRIPHFSHLSPLSPPKNATGPRTLQHSARTFAISSAAPRLDALDSSTAHVLTHHRQPPRYARCDCSNDEYSDVNTSEGQRRCAGEEVQMPVLQSRIQSVRTQEPAREIA
jgi:hypothetical protein